jgi:hypothetical protein
VNRRLYLLLLLSFLLEALSSSAQERLDPAALLLTALQDPSVLAQQQHVQFAKSHQPRLALVDGAQLRTESNRFELIRQEYLARLSWNGILEKKRYQQLQTVSVQTSQTQLEESFSEVLLQRYLLLHLYRSTQQKQGLQYQLIQVLQDKKTVLQVLSANSDQADPSDLYKLQFDLDKLELDHLESTQLQAQVQAQIADWLPNTILLPIDTSSWIQPTELYQNLQKTTDFSSLFAESMQHKAKLSEIDAEIRLETAKSRQIIDFIQFRYGNRPGDPFRYAAAVSLGLNVPFNSSRTAKKQELRIEQHEEETKLSVLQQELLQEKKQLLRDLERYLQQFQLIHRQIEDGKKQFAPEKLVQLEKNSLVTLLQYQELQLKRQLQQAEIAEQMQEVYLQYLFLNGNISRLFRQNYLKSGWPAY